MKRKQFLKKYAKVKDPKEIDGWLAWLILGSGAITALKADPHTMLLAEVMADIANMEKKERKPNLQAKMPQCSRRCMEIFGENLFEILAPKPKSSPITTYISERKFWDPTSRDVSPNQAKRYASTVGKPSLTPTTYLVNGGVSHMDRYANLREEGMYDDKG